MIKIPTLSNLGVTRRECRVKNGVLLVHFEKLHAPVSVRATFLSGGRFDPSGRDGTAHFVEHMLVAGTRSFPSKDKLALAIERLGGSIAASTGLDSLKVDMGVSDPTDIDFLTSTLAEILTGSLFLPETVEMERGSILKEIGLYKSGMAQLCDRAWHELIFQGTLLERFVLGTEETVSALSRDNLMAFYNDCVSPNRLTLVTSGGISIDVLAESFNEHLIMKPSRVEMNMPKALLPKQRKQSISVVHNETSDQVFMTLGFRTGSIFEKDVSILDLIAGVTGGSRASLLLKKLRYEKGLVYSASAVSYGLSDAGEWSIHTSTSVSQIKEAVNAIFAIIREIKEVGLPDDLVAASKESAVKSLRSRYQTSASWVGSHSYSESIGRVGETILDWTRDYVNVTQDDIIRVARKYFTSDGWYVAMVGKINEEDLPAMSV